MTEWYSTIYMYVCITIFIHSSVMGHLDCKLIKPLWRTLWRFLKKLKIKLLYDSANPLLVIHPENICTPVFTVALFTSARTWKHPKCPKVKYDLKKIENAGTIYDRYWVSQLFSYKKKLSSGRMKLWSCSGTHNLNHKAFYRSCFKFFFNQYMHQYILDDHPSVYIVPKCIRQIVNNKNFCVSQEFPNRTFCPTKYNVTYVLLIFWMHLLTQSIDFRARVLKCNLKITHSVQFSRSVSNSLWCYEPQHIRPPCPSPAPALHPNPCPLSRWCHPAISSSVVSFSSCPQSFPASGSLQMSRLFASGDQNIGISASTSVFPMNTQDWSPLGWTGWISWQSKGLSRVFSNTTVQKHQFFGAQLPSQSNPHIHTWPLEKP